MKFKALPVTSLEDATIDFEQLSAKDILNLTAESVLQLAATGTTRKAAFGALTVTFTASSQSATTVVAHGLGATPLGVWLQVTGSNFIAGNVVSVGSTSFTAQGYDTLNSAVTGTFSFYWLAVG